MAESVGTIVLSYLGAATGIVGAVLGYLGYRQSRHIKSLDLRIELRKAASDLRADVLELPALLENARGSRAAINAARGLSFTGAFEAWKGQLETDLVSAQALASELPAADNTFRKASQAELEAKLVDVHALGRRANSLRQKYVAAPLGG